MNLINIVLYVINNQQLQMLVFSVFIVYSFIRCARTLQKLKYLKKCLNPSSNRLFIYASIRQVYFRLGHFFSIFVRVLTAILNMKGIYAWEVMEISNQSWTITRKKKRKSVNKLHKKDCKSLLTKETLVTSPAHLPDL